MSDITVVARDGERKVSPREYHWLTRRGLINNSTFNPMSSRVSATRNIAMRHIVANIEFLAQVETRVANGDSVAAKILHKAKFPPEEEG